MQQALVYLGYIGALILAGLLCSFIASKLRISNALILLLAGIILGKISYNGQQIFMFPELFLTAAGIIAIVMVVFDSASKLNFRDSDSFSSRIWKFVILNSSLSIVLLTAVTYILIRTSILDAFILSALMIGTAPELLINPSSSRKSNRRLFEFLKTEAMFNTCISVIIPIIAADMALSFFGKSTMFGNMITLSPLAQEMIFGIGTGIFIAVIIFKVIHKYYHKTYSPLVLALSALIAYIVAETIHGSGILSVASLGIFFANTYIKEKKSFEQFNYIITGIAGTAIFLLVGILFDIRFTADILIKSLAIFAALIAVRAISLQIAIGKEYSAKEKMFMLLSCPKGIAFIVAAFILSSYTMLNLSFIINIGLVVFIYSVIASAIAELSLRHKI